MLRKRWRNATFMTSSPVPSEDKDGINPELDSVGDDSDEIIDKREDGASVYYYVKRKFLDDYIYLWESEDKLHCSKKQIENFNKQFQKTQKLKRKRVENGLVNRTRKTSLKETLLPCACVQDSPFNPNRSFRGSLCDF